MVPAGTYHNVVNTSKTALLKLYTIFLRQTSDGIQRQAAVSSECPGTRSKRVGPARQAELLPNCTSTGLWPDSS